MSRASRRRAYKRRKAVRKRIDRGGGILGAFLDFIKSQETGLSFLRGPRRG